MYVFLCMYVCMGVYVCVCVCACACVCLCGPYAAVVSQPISAFYASVQFEDLWRNPEETLVIGPYTKKHHISEYAMQ